MENTTQFSSFILDAYLDIGSLKYLYFTLVSFLYIMIILANALLIVVICVKRTLHEPMYLLLVNLFVNEIYGSTGLFPSLMIQLLSDVHSVSTMFCFMQMFCLYTYGSIEMVTFALMAYDRYLAICNPLRYRNIMTPNRVCVSISIIWIYCFLKSVIPLSWTNHLQLCGNLIDKVYCDNYNVLKLACYSSTTANNIYGLIFTFWSVGVPLVLILVSYGKILRICSNGSKETRQKAIATCTPHLVSLLNFVFGGLFEIVQNRFDKSYLPNICRILLSLYFLICQPLLSPLIYGMRMSKIREACWDVVMRNK